MSSGSDTVLAHQKISTESGGFPDTLDDFDRFGKSVAALGDLDGDGVGDLVVGASTDVSQGLTTGAVWLFFLARDATVKSFRKIAGDGVPGGAFTPGFGVSVAVLGDLDGDGVQDVVVGADGDGVRDRGAVWVLFLARDGTARSRQKIGDAQGGFTGVLRDLDLFGTSVAGPGDLDGDGVVDLVVGARGDDDGGNSRGAVWELFLERDGTVKGHRKIRTGSGGFSGVLANNDGFGSSLADLGDLDGDGSPDLAVGALGTDTSRGAVWVLFLGPDGTVASQQKIGSGTGGFAGTLDSIDLFGSALASLGDLDGDGIGDLAVGSSGDQDGGVGSFDHRGAAYVLFLRADGTVRAHQKISATRGGFTGVLGEDGFFGAGVANLGDLDGDGKREVVVGAPETGESRGIAWVLSLDAAGRVTRNRAIQDGLAGFGPSTLEPVDAFGRAQAVIGDVDGDGVSDLAVGAPIFGYTSRSDPTGSLYVLFLREDGTVKAFQEIRSGAGGLAPGALSGFDSFGTSIAPLGDLDGNGVPDLAVGASNLGGLGGVDSRLGAIFVLFLEADATVRRHEIVRPERFLLNEGDEVGRSLASLGDFDGDGIVDLVAGAPGDDDGGVYNSDNFGAVWLFFLNADGTLKASQKISRTQGGFTAPLAFREEFGESVATLGDLDGDGIIDLAVGARYNHEGGFYRGAAYVLFLRPDGTVKGYSKISSTQGGFVGPLQDGDQFGAAVAGPRDLNGDGLVDLVVGAPGSTNGVTGSIWVLFLRSDGTVLDEMRIRSGLAGFTGYCDPFDRFGASIAAFGDLDGDGGADLGVGASGDDDGGGDEGAVWILSTSLTSNAAPDCSAAGATSIELWPPDHEFHELDILAVTGISDPDGDTLSLVIDAITQDEPVFGRGSGETGPDGTGVGTGIALVRAERDGRGNGRVYHVSFTVTDEAGASCQGMLRVSVPRDRATSGDAVDDGQAYDSTEQGPARARR